MRIINYCLCLKYPFLRIRNRWTDVAQNYSSTEIDFLPKGWRKAWGLKICKELNQCFKKSNEKDFAKQYRISQIKEKYGSLRWYDNGFPQDIEKECNAIISKYEKLSENTCIMCGKNAKIINNGGWYEPLCPKCQHKIEKKKERLLWKK